MAENVFGDNIWELDEYDETATKPIDPVWTLDQKNQEDVLDWIENAVSVIKKANDSRYDLCVKNLAKYRGIHYQSQDLNGRFLDSDRKAEVDTRKIVVNEIFESTERRTAKLTRFKPSTVPVPATNEYNDKVDAQTVKKILETVEYQNDRESLVRQITKRMQIFGEQDVLITWDKDKGALHPKWKKLKAAYDKSGKKGKKLIAVTEGGVTTKVTFDPKRPVYIGDISYKIPLPWELHKDLKTCPEEVEFIVHEYYEHVEKTRRDHPEIAASKITADDSNYRYDVETFCARKVEDHVVIRELWARSSKYLPDGMYLKATPSVLLVKPEANPYPENDTSRWGNLPIETRRDIDVPNYLHGSSAYQIFGNLQSIINQGYSSAHRALMLLGAPKLAVPRGANIDKVKLGNDVTMFEYSGDALPTILNSATIHPEVFNWLQLITDKLKGQAGTHPVSSGKPPEGIKAGIAIRMLEEIENEARSSDIKNQNDLVVALDRKTLSVISKYYKDSDERLIKIVGRDKAYTVESFKTAVLERSYDIRVKLASSLPQTPAARTQTVIDLHQMMPGLFTREAVIDALDLSEPGKLVDAVTAAKSAAEWENEEFVRGRVPPEPREGENLQVHWHTHNTFYQSRGWMELPKKSKENFEDHQLATEYLMWVHAQKNPKFAQSLLELENYPQFFVMPEQDAAPAPYAVGDQGGAPAQPGQLPGVGAGAPQGQEFPQATPSPDNVLTPGSPSAALGA